LSLSPNSAVAANGDAIGQHRKSVQSLYQDHADKLMTAAPNAVITTPAAAPVPVTKQEDVVMG
jgi:hypothetical protein